MSPDEFTPRAVAKSLVSSAIAMKAAEIAKDVALDHTGFGEDSMTVKLGSKVVGAYTAHKFKPLTDRMVDGSIDHIMTFRAKRQNEKAKKDRLKKDQ
jgi:hypothetical protein